MNVSLTPKLEALVNEKVASGEYSDPSEVVRDALRLMQERDIQSRLLQELNIGIAQLARGEFVEFAPDTMSAWISTATERATHGQPIKDAVKA